METINVSNLGEILKKHEMTQKDFSEMAQLSVGTVNRMMQCKNADHTFKCNSKTKHAYETTINYLEGKIPLDNTLQNTPLIPTINPCGNSYHTELVEMVRANKLPRCIVSEEKQGIINGIYNVLMYASSRGADLYLEPLYNLLHQIQDDSYSSLYFALKLAQMPHNYNDILRARGYTSWRVAYVLLVTAFRDGIENFKKSYNETADNKTIGSFSTEYIRAFFKQWIENNSEVIVSCLLPAIHNEAINGKSGICGESRRYINYLCQFDSIKERVLFDCMKNQIIVEEPDSVRHFSCTDRFFTIAEAEQMKETEFLFYLLPYLRYTFYGIVIADAEATHGDRYEGVKECLLSEIDGILKTIGEINTSWGVQLKIREE